MPRFGFAISVRLLPRNRRCFGAARRGRGHFDSKCSSEIEGGARRRQTEGAVAVDAGLLVQTSLAANLARLHPVRLLRVSLQILCWFLGIRPGCLGTAICSKDRGSPGGAAFRIPKLRAVRVGAGTLGVVWAAIEGRIRGLSGVRGTAASESDSEERYVTRSKKPENKGLFDESVV